MPPGGHVWEDPLDTGYQQTRAMMCIASGGLLGLGAGSGWLKYVAAADTDLVFALCLGGMGTAHRHHDGAGRGHVWACSCVRSAPVGRSSFYTIGACAAVSILMIQTILNVFGTVDLLPLTGVTFPFVSNGGSSMLSVVGAAGLYQGGGYPAERQLCRSAGHRAEEAAAV